MTDEITNIAFDTDALRDDGFQVHLAGYEGPLDLLLDMARHQKVDLAQISVLQLAEQYIRYVEEAKSLKIEIAADYLVMAAWLTYLKSRLLLPKEEQLPADEPSAAQLADALSFQLRRLQGMKKAANDLDALPQRGSGFWCRGAPEGFVRDVKLQRTDTLYELLTAYGTQLQRSENAHYTLPDQYVLYTLDDAIERIGQMFGAKGLWRSHDWIALQDIYQATTEVNLATVSGKSLVAAMFSATLEMSKAGQIELSQEKSFSPLFMRARDARAE